VTRVLKVPERVLTAQPDAKHALPGSGEDTRSTAVTGLPAPTGTELDDKQTAKDAGVVQGMLLVLRQSTVKGGA
jgi:hypothetical protein